MTKQEEEALLEKVAKLSKELKELRTDHGELEDRINDQIDGDIKDLQRGVEDLQSFQEDTENVSFGDDIKEVEMSLEDLRRDHENLEENLDKTTNDLADDISDLRDAMWKRSHRFRYAYRYLKFKFQEWRRRNARKKSTRSNKVRQRSR